MIISSHDDDRAGGQAQTSSDIASPDIAEAFARQGHADPLSARAPFPLRPIVSVIVVNYNYGRYLEDAVESVFGQTYPAIECVVVDNASTDTSAEVIAALAARHAGLIVVRRARNDGQTPASLDGLEASSGQYVIFLDADDYLLPYCVETHVFAHLSMRPHVGFTSGDMLQVAEKHVVVSTGEESNRFMRGRRGLKPALVRPFDEIAGWPAPRVRDGIERKLHYVRPLTTRWVWSPTSGLCYRRDALLLFADNARLKALRTGTDLYFALGCGGLSGSVVIDAPLFAYRIHGGNIFTARAQLDRTLNYVIGGHGDSNTLAQLYLIDHLVERAARFAPNFWLQLNLFALLWRVDLHDRDPTLPAFARRSRAARGIATHYESFAAALGRPLARVALAWFAKSLRAPKSLAASVAQSQAEPRRPKNT